MATLREVIVRSMCEGCRVILYSNQFDSNMTYLGVDYFGAEILSKGNEVPSISLFFESVEDELLNLGWEKFNRSERSYRDFDQESRWYRLRNRYARVDTKLEHGYVLGDSKTPLIKIAVLVIYPTFEYAIQSEMKHGGAICSDMYDLQEVREVFHKYGWVVTKASKEITSDYTCIKEAVFFENDFCVAVTGYVGDKTVVIIRLKDYTMI